MGHAESSNVNWVHEAAGCDALNFQLDPCAIRVS